MVHENPRQEGLVRIGCRYFSQASMKELLETEPPADAQALSVPVLPIH